ALDTNNDGTVNVTQLGAAMQDFTFDMPDATTLGLRVRCRSNVAGESILIDHVVVTGAPREIEVANNNDSGPGSLRAPISEALGKAGLRRSALIPVSVERRSPWLRPWRLLTRTASRSMPQRFLQASPFPEPTPISYF
ncbi:MAG: hypothetical protein ACKVHP_21945, partial [Verrucomicrobiales bacterium]